MDNKQQVHVLYIITKLELGGAQKVCLSLLEGVRAHGTSSSLISGTEGALVKEARRFDEVYLLKSLTRDVGLLSVLRELRAFWQLFRQIRKQKRIHPDLIVHTHSTKAGLMGRWAAFCARVKRRVHTVHGFGFHEHQGRLSWWLIFIAEYMTSFITTHYVCVSEQDRRTGIRYIPFFEGKSSIIRAAVSWDQFYVPAKRADMHNEVFTFGTVSCFKPQKNLFDLLRAFEKVHANASRAVCLEIVGDGMQRDAIQAWIEKHHLSEAITLHGWQDNVAGIMHTWDVFVMSSLWEGLPCAVIEARLCKLPVITYDVGGICEVITSGVNGFVVTPGKWEELSNRMLSVVDSSTLYETLHHAPDNLSDFHHERMVEKHVALYAQLSSKGQ